MSKSRLVCVLLAISFFMGFIPFAPSVNSETGWQWEELPPMLYPAKGYAEVYNGEIYHIGEDYIQVYSPSNNTWWVFGNANTGYRDGSAIIGDRIYFIDNGDAKFLNITTLSYHDISDAPTSRWDSDMVALNNTLYLIGGTTGGLIGTNIVEAYSPSNDTWWLVSPLNEGRYDLQVVVYGYNIYAIGGDYSLFNHLYTVEKYYPGNDTWSYVASINNFCTSGSATALSYGIVMENGANSETYFPDLDIWIEGPDAPWNGDNHEMVTLNDEAYIVGGRLPNDTPLDHFYRWDGLESNSPSIAITSHTPNEFVDQTINVTGTASDNFQLFSVEISLDQNNWTVCNGNETWYAELTMQPGLNTVYARATDYFNNTGTTYVEVIYDILPPEIMVSEPLNNSIISAKNVTINGTAFDEWGLSHAQIKVNDGVWLLCSGTYDWSRNITLDEGENTIIARAFDSELNMNSTTINITVDTQLPSITITSPEDNILTAESQINISGNAADNIEIQKVEISRNLTNWTLCNGTSSWSDTVQLEHGVNIFYFRATDIVGNNITTVISITADHRPPNIWISSHFDGANVSEANITLSGTATDSYGIDSVEVQLNQGSWVSCNGTENWQINLALEEGLNTINVRATDILGNSDSTSIEILHWIEQVEPEPEPEPPIEIDNTNLNIAAFLISAVIMIILFSMIYQSGKS